MKLKYQDFYRIVKCLNEINNNNIYTSRDAYNYKVEYDCSIEQGFPSLVMRDLCKELVYDMDYKDYEEFTQELLDIETMSYTLKSFLIDKC